MSDPGAATVSERERAFVGRVISERYRVEARIASGGMGAVFRGQHLRLRKRVAIKILHGEIEGVLELAEQFEREAIAGAHVSHPNVAAATDFGRLDDGSFFLIQEFLKGETLAKVLRRGPLSVDRALHISKQMAAALQAVHEMDIVHRDVKPSNMMLIADTDDHAKLIDFGFARVPMARMSVAREDDPLHDHDGMWDPDTMFGTIGYLAPEAAKGVDAIDGRSDLYALGVSMYEMLTGKLPFEAPTSAALFRMHRNEPPPPFVKRAPMVPIPAALEGVVMKLLAKDPDERYQTGTELIQALDRVVVGRPSAYPQQGRITLDEIVVTTPRRSRLGSLVAVIGVIAVAGAVVWLVPGLRSSLGLSAAPSASAVSSGAGPSTASAAPTKVDGLGAAGWTARLLAAPKRADWEGGAKALGALARLDAEALRAEEVAKAAANLAIGATHKPASAKTAEEIFQLLAQRFGSDGPDVLYRITDRLPPSHPAAKRAASLLLEPEVLKRATPSLTLAIRLREDPCEKKAFLFDRAASIGDARALKALQRLRAQPCRSATDPCCFRANEELGRTIRELAKRLKSK
ncbi:MAG: serine/threonine protein kinase [Deltaproteobacteria bacterium]|nr:serine/threonine protein kinase [Deltaproteobacteria bacterium]MBW2532202.1 serine/threonine protein kinase [Deltaproteobacteria bacterium]